MSSSSADQSSLVVHSSQQLFDIKHYLLLTGPALEYRSWWFVLLFSNISFMQTVCELKSWQFLGKPKINWTCCVSIFPFHWTGLDYRRVIGYQFALINTSSSSCPSRLHLNISRLEGAPSFDGVHLNTLESYTIPSQVPGNKASSWSYQ